MIDVRVNNLTRQNVGYYRFPVVPRVGEGIIIVRDGDYSDRLEVVDALRGFALFGILLPKDLKCT